MSVWSVSERLRRYAPGGVGAGSVGADLELKQLLDAAAHEIEQFSMWRDAVGDALFERLSISERPSPTTFTSCIQTIADQRDRYREAALRASEAAVSRPLIVNERATDDAACVALAVQVAKQIEDIAKDSRIANSPEADEWKDDMRYIESLAAGLQRSIGSPPDAP